MYLTKNLSISDFSLPKKSLQHLVTYTLHCPFDINVFTMYSIYQSTHVNQIDP